MPVKIDMDMPKMCEDCPIYDLNMGRCCVTKSFVQNAATKLNNCPLKECKQIQEDNSGNK